MCEETKPCRLSHFQKYDQYTGPSMYCMIEAKHYKVHRFQGKQFLVNVFQVKKLHSSVKLSSSIPQTFRTPV